MSTMLIMDQVSAFTGFSLNLVHQFFSKAISWALSWVTTFSPLQLLQIPFFALTPVPRQSGQSTRLMMPVPSQEMHFLIMPKVLPFPLHSLHLYDARISCPSSVRGQFLYCSVTLCVLERAIYTVSMKVRWILLNTTMPSARMKAAKPAV